MSTWPTKLLVNVGTEPFEYDAVVDGQPYSIVLEPGTDAAVPLSDDEIAQQQADEQAAAAAQAAYQAAPATADDHAAVTAQIRTEKLASVPIPRDQLEAIMQQLLGESAAAIPFFEKYAHDPSLTSQQWADFQALDQATKDRLLYDLIRTNAALLRYLTGDLPTS